MIQTVDLRSIGADLGVLHEMHRLRYRVFKVRLGWEVTTSGDLEIDAYDVQRPTYLLYRGDDGGVEGCVRLLPTTGSYMLRNTFPALLGDQPAPCDHRTWEASRFSLDTSSCLSKTDGGLSQGTLELFAGVLEFCRKQKIHRLVAVIDLRFERILRRAQWPLQRISAPRQIGKTAAVAGFLDISSEIHSRMCELAGLDGRVLAYPKLPAAA